MIQSKGVCIAWRDINADSGISLNGFNDVFHRVNRFCGDAVSTPDNIDENVFYPCYVWAAITNTDEADRNVSLHDDI